MEVETDIGNDRKNWGQYLLIRYFLSVMSELPGGMDYLQFLTSDYRNTGKYTNESGSNDF